MNDPRYPIGKIELPGALTPAARAQAIATLAGVPHALHDAVRGLDQAQLDTPYRDGGWTLRQVVHHIADSHVNAYVRHKLTITEKSPPPIPGTSSGLAAGVPASPLQDPALVRLAAAVAVGALVVGGALGFVVGLATR